jgi:hypothetical protein
MTLTLLDNALPRYDVHEVHRIDIHATPEKVYGIIKQYRFGSSPLFRFLFGLRKLAGLPLAIFKPKLIKDAWAFEEPPMLEVKPFVKVAEVPNDEVVMGLIGKFWEPAPKTINLADGQAFMQFSDTAYAKTAMNFKLLPTATGTTLTTETRIYTPNKMGRFLFSLYWTAIGFFSGVIRADMLKRIKIEAEKSL